MRALTLTNSLQRTQFPPIGFMPLGCAVVRSLITGLLVGHKPQNEVMQVIEQLLEQHFFLVVKGWLHHKFNYQLQLQQARQGKQAIRTITIAVVSFVQIRIITRTEERMKRSEPIVGMNQSFVAALVVILFLYI